MTPSVKVPSESIRVDRIVEDVRRHAFQNRRILGAEQADVDGHATTTESGRAWRCLPPESGIAVVQPDVDAQTEVIRAADRHHLRAES